MRKKGANQKWQRKRGTRMATAKRNAAKVKGGKGHVKNRAAGQRIMRT